MGYKPAAMPPDNKSRLSMRIAPDLEKFLREKADERDTRFTNFVEEVIATGAMAYGFQPDKPTKDATRFAEVIASMVIEHLEAKDASSKGQAEN